MYAIVINGIVDRYPLSMADLREIFPNVSFAVDPSDSDLSQFNIVNVQYTQQPEYNTFTHKLIKTTPELVNNVWKESWSIQSLSTEEVNIQLSSYRTGLVCTPRQASLALLQLELLDIVESWIETQPRQTQIDWNRATEIRRDWPLIDQAGVALNLTETQLDDLFLLAMTL